MKLLRRKRFGFLATAIVMAVCLIIHVPGNRVSAQAGAANGDLASDNPSSSAFSDVRVTINGDRSASLQGKWTEGGNRSITIKVAAPDGTIDYLDQTTSAGDGSFGFEFVLSSALHGVYSVKLGASGLKQPYETSFSDTETGLVPKAELTGSPSVRQGETFDLNIGFSGLAADIFAQDITLAFDPAKLEFIDLIPLNENYSVIEKDAGKAASGEIRILTAILNKEADRNGHMYIVRMKAKEASASVNATINAAIMIASGDGAEQALESASHQLRITVGAKGDVNDDGKISIGDLGMAAGAYGKTSSDPLWNELYSRADMNGDNKIDIEDIAYIARKLLEL